jgi:putative oxidoreductase
VTPEVAHWMILSGRILMGAFYAMAGVHHFLTLDQMTELMAARNVPAPQAVLIAGSVFQSIAGLLLIAGIFQACAAIGLILFTLIAGMVLLNFWHLKGDLRHNAITQWRCNLGLIGGLLALCAAP